MQTKLTRRKSFIPAPPTQIALRRQLNQAAVEGNRLPNRDPLAQVTEQFRETFDQIGRQRAAQLSQTEGGGFSKAEGEAEKSLRLRRQADSAARGRQLRSHRELPASPIETFSEMAFQRGTMAASVLQGTGRLMLATCLKRSLGQNTPMEHRQTLFGGGTQVRTVPGNAPDQMVFHRGFAQSAVGLVVDVLSDARAVVDSMAEMAAGTGPLEADEGASTLRRVYPFLDDSRERRLLEGYRAQLAQTRDSREKPVLQNAILHTEALIGRKAQMKNEFINKLRWISDKAQEAAAELDSRETLDYLVTALETAEAALPPEPPEQPPADPGASGPADQGKGKPPHAAKPTDQPRPEEGTEPAQTDPAQQTER